MPLDTVQGDGIDHATVDEDHAAALHGFVKRGKGDAGADGLEQTALADDDLATSFQVGGNGAIGYRQVLDEHVGHELHDGLDDTFALHQVIERQREIGELKHFLPVDGLHPSPKLL